MTPPGGARRLTDGERTLAQSIYRAAIDLDRVEIRRRRWWPLQPRSIVMAPTGHIHLHPKSPSWCEDFSRQGHALQGLFLHELCHVWQHQRGLFLPLRRHPFCRYDYSFRPGVPLTGYGIEQQAEIVRHAFLMREGVPVVGAPSLQQYETLLPF